MHKYDPFTADHECERHIGSMPFAETTGPKEISLPSPSSSVDVDWWREPGISALQCCAVCWRYWCSLYSPNSVLPGAKPFLRHWAARQSQGNSPLHGMYRQGLHLKSDFFVLRSCFQFLRRFHSLKCSPWKCPCRVSFFYLCKRYNYMVRQFPRM